MYILVQTCTIFLEIITVGVMHILVQTCTIFFGNKKSGTVCICLYRLVWYEFVRGH